MKQLTRSALVLVILLTFIGTVWATTYYVDSDATVNGSGTIGSPYNYFFNPYARISLNPGDSVRFKCGNTNPYSQIVLNFNGSAGNTITLSTYGTGSQPKITSAGAPISTWGSPDGNGVYTKNVGSVTVKTFLEDWHNLKNASTSTCSDGNWYYSSPNLYYKPTDGNNASTHCIRICQVGYSIYPANNSYGNYVTYDNLCFKEPCIMSGSSNTNITYQNCAFTEINGCNALNFFSSPGSITTNLTINNCTFQYCANNVYFIRLTDATAYFSNVHITNCKFLHTGEIYGSIYNYVGGDMDGISCQNIQNSTIEHNEISGICSQSAGINCWFDGSGPGTGNIIRCNYIHDITQGGGINWGGSDNNTCNAQIYSNIIVNCAGCPGAGAPGGINLQRAQTPGTSTTVYNNVVYGCNVGIFYSNLAAYFDVKNNIVMNSETYQVQMSTNNSNITSDYNCYFPSIGNAFYWSGNPCTYATWQSKLYDAHSVTSNPSFINPSTGDFRLNFNSPCKKAGIWVNINYDYFGNYFEPAPSMGAIQYSKTGGVISARTVSGSHY